ncbi:MAG: hypothetical protein IPF87_09170 [Gemmatimonadetes bacterium]|nr:hypothetical protein [Gemmatimonadota bacterium]
MTHNAWFDVVRLDASAAQGDTGVTIGMIERPTGVSVGGEARRQLPRPSVGPEGRVFWPEQRVASAGRPGGTALVSITLDGKDRREHLTFPAADEMVPSPDGEWIAFQEGDNVYVAPMAYGGVGADAQRIEKRRGQFRLPRSRATAGSIRAGATARRSSSPAARTSTSTTSTPSAPTRSLCG